MISRLSAFAATFAVLATASLALAASVPALVRQPEATVSRAAAETMPVVQLERVVITGKRVAKPSSL